MTVEKTSQKRAQEMDTHDEKCECDKLRRWMQWVLGGLAGCMLLCATAGITAYVSLTTSVAVMQSRFDNLEVPPSWFKAQVDRIETTVGDIDRRLDQMERSP